MIHVTIPVAAKGEPIPLVKLGQGREETSTETAAEAIGRGGKTLAPMPPIFLGGLAEKLRAAGYQEPVLPVSQPPVVATGTVDLSQKEFDELTKRNELPLVSQRGFKAGVFATCLGGVFLGALYFGCGALICGCVASGCVGFVAGMLMTEDWK
jgi:hypothetical protein